MLIIGNTLLSYEARGLGSAQSATRLQESARPDSTESVASTQVSISEQARHALLLEGSEDLTAELQAQAIAKSDEQKVQYSDNLMTFINAAQKYAQQDTAQPLIENREAISAYSLIANRVVATTASNNLEG